jgi:hypothetical protein
MRGSFGPQKCRLYDRPGQVAAASSRMEVSPSRAALKELVLKRKMNGVMVWSPAVIVHRGLTNANTFVHKKFVAVVDGRTRRG